MNFLRILRSLPSSVLPCWPAALALALLASGCDGEEDAASSETPSPAASSATAPPPDRPDAPLYGTLGPHDVGHRVLQYASPERERPLSIKAWYPTARGATAQGPISYPLRLKSPEWQALQPAVVLGRASLDAPVDASEPRYPLVVFSHGYALSPEWYSRLVEHLASRGFVVLAPEHEESDWLAAQQALFQRPADIRDVLDFAETSPTSDLLAAIDRDRIALVGHSFGGYTALAVGGARLDLAPFTERCGALSAEDPRQFLCAPFLGREKEMASMAGLAEVPDGLWPSLRDDRVKVIVPIAGDAFLFNESGLSQLHVPMMALGGTEDFGTPWDWGAELAYSSAASASKALVGLEGGSHMLAANPCGDLPWAPRLPAMEYGVFCFDPVWDRDRALDLIEHYTTAFLLEALLQDPQAHGALLPSSPHATGIHFETTMK